MMPARFIILYFVFLFQFNVSSQEGIKLCDDGSWPDITNSSSLKYDQGVSPMACASGSNLVTIYATNNAQRGHMFDITANNCVTILCFEMNFNAGTSNVDIYTKTGTHVGSENTAGAWTLVGSAAAVTSAGVNLPTAIPITVNQLIATGATRAFYITRTTAAGPTVAYTNGTAVGTTLASDANIIIKEGTGKELLFSTNFTPRRFNGRVFYNLNPPCVLPIELIKFDAVNKGKTIDLSWTTATEKNNNYFVVERSKDGKAFEEVKNVIGAGNSTSQKEYFESDENPYSGVSYYRLKQVDFSGEYSYSDIKTVNVKRNALSKVSITPVPADTYLNIEFNSEPGTEYSIYIFDIAGKKVYSEKVIAEKEFVIKQAQINILEKGMYFITISGNNDSSRIKFIKE